MGIRWGHFSDLHFKYGDNFDTQLLKKSLCKAVEDSGAPLQYLFITGDIFHKGVLDDKTVPFILDIAKAARCEPSHIFLCPGNHDGRRMRLRKLVIEDQLKQYQKTNNLDISSDFWEQLIEKPFSEFQEACKSISGNDAEITSPHFVKELDHIRLFVLNSAIFAGQTYPGQEGDISEEDKRNEDHNLYICDKHLADLLDRSGSADSGGHRLNIVMMHHGVECLAQGEQRKFKDFLDQLHADLILCGHVHRNTNCEVNQTAARIRQVSCGGLFVDGYNEPSFVIGEYLPETGNIKLCNYYFDSGDWSISPKAPKPYVNGVFEFTPQRLQAAAQETSAVTAPQHLKIPVNHGMLGYNDILQNNIILVVRATQQRNDTPFENRGEQLCRLYPALKKNHLLFLDKLYLSLLPENNYLTEVPKCISAEQILLRHDVYGVLIGKLQELLTSEKDGAMSPAPDKLDDLINFVVSNSYALSFALTQRLFEQEVHDTKFRYRLMKNDMSENAAVFIGYEVQQKELSRALTKSGYIYISGDQFFGKTSLLEKVLSDRIAAQNPGAFSSPLPWGPEHFVIFGKQAADRGTAMQMLIEQANLVLPNPIDHKDNPSDPYYFESLIQILCEQLERVVIIIDALDEIGMDDLSLFPDELPKNCTVVLSSKRSLSDTTFKAKNEMVHIKVDGLSTDDFLKITGLTRKQKGVSHFVNITVKRTKGSPYLLSRVAQEIRAAGGELPKTNEQFLQSLSSPFEKFKRCWKENGSANCPLYHILNLLTIFEQVDYIKIKDIQSYLKARGYVYTSEQIRSCLIPVRAQLDSDKNERFKLKYNAFASYLIDQYTADDFEIIFNSVLDWLLDYQDKFEYLDRFLITGYVLDSFTQEQALSMLQLLIKEKKQKELKRILALLCTLALLGEEFKSRISPGIELCFSYLKDDEDAIKTYFNYLYQEAKDEQAKRDALQYLKQLADRGNTDAIISYARLLFSGDLYLDADPAQALIYLNKAEQTEDVLWELLTIYQEIKDDENAKKSFDKLLKFQSSRAKNAYASYLGIGKYYKRDLQKCEALLNDLIAQGDERAVFTKASLIFYYSFPGYTMDDAYLLYDKLSKIKPLGDFYKALILIKEKGEREKGLRLMRKAEKKGSADARIYLLDKKIKQEKRLSNAEVTFLIHETKNWNYNAALLLYSSIDKNLIDKKAFDMNALIKFADNRLSHTHDAFNFFYHKDYRTAFVLFERDYREHGAGASNMAYMLRKGFVSSKSYDIEELLAPGIKENGAFAIINHILYQLPQIACRDEKRQAVLLLGKIPIDNQFEDAIDWWRGLSEQGDAEGDFVLGLLLYTKRLATDPDGRSMQQRFDKARAGGFDLSFLDLS